ncbi:Hypothetical protein ABZS17G119_04314 (plasmid) [Kosakonia cowanii]
MGLMEDDDAEKISGSFSHDVRYAIASIACKQRMMHAV